MNKKRRLVNWRLRIGATLSMLVSTVWGYWLSQTLVQLNAQQSVRVVFLLAFPLAFAGSMFVALLFRMLTREWRTVLRAFVALSMFAVGFAVGMMRSVLVEQLDLVQQLGGMNPLVWEFEWVFALVGVFAGTWPTWARPFYQRVAELGLWLIARPLRLLEIVAQALGILFTALIFFPLRLLHAAALSLYLLRLRLTRAVNAFRERPRPPVQLSIYPDAPVKMKTRKLRRHKNARVGLRVTGSVEDRCPYCLDIVKRNDPRGVKVCSVCGAPHHADCWAITNKCQVPHLNT
ncbi:MAG: hypothetical protein HY741_04380 [Chloroflexi bacterium]|nr:hypothetical protein [Chloroflexota bacterium]